MINPIHSTFHSESKINNYCDLWSERYQPMSFFQVVIVIINIVVVFNIPKAKVDCFVGTEYDILYHVCDVDTNKTIIQVLKK